MSILIVDNQDSFTYNLFHYCRSLSKEPIAVKRSEEIKFANLKTFSKIIFSPGPELPKHHPIMFDILDKFAHNKQILGICLGHQAIAEFFGGKLIQLETPRHGVSEIISVCVPNDPLFQKLPKSFSVGLYHSWVIDDAALPDTLTITSKSPTGIMSVAHKKLNIKGLQFHPESIMSPYGLDILRNWLFLKP